MSDIVVGIDLGTTRSCVGLYNMETKKVDILANQYGETVTPSWVSFLENGDIKVGRASQQCAEEGKHAVYDSKRIISKNFSDEDIAELDRSVWPFSIKRGENDSILLPCPG